MRISDWSSDVCSSDLLLDCVSGYSDHTHHAGLQVFEDVAVKHPVAGIVGDEGDVDPLPRCHEHGVLPFAEPRRCAVPGDHSERMTVQVARMGPDRKSTRLYSSH